MWILKQKKQVEKQKKLIWNSSKKSLDWQKRDYVNPNGNSYVWFFRSWKLVCDITSWREDPDWFRILRKPNSWEVEFKKTWLDSWYFRRYIKKSRRHNI